MARIERAGDEGGADALATVAKRATDAVGRRALANEAMVLRRLAHPGVVRLVAHTDTERHAQLVTERVPGETLADLDVDSPSAIAALGAAAAAVVADLHELGVAHGSITPAHLIVSDGRVVLCSFGRATEATPAAMDRDVADLVTAITAAAGRLEEPGTRVERRQMRRIDELLVGAASRSLSASDLAASLASLADDGTGEAVGGVPGAAVRPGPETTGTRSPGPFLRRTPVPGEPAPPPRSRPDRLAPDSSAVPWRGRVVRARRDSPAGNSFDRRQRRRGIVIGAAAGLTVVAAWAVLAPDRTGTPTPPTTTSVAAPPATQTPFPTAIATPPPPSPPVDPVDVVVVGNLVSIDDAWFEVGRSSDIVRVGDWDCDGIVSPAVLRPPTGEVFVFDGWPEGAETRRIEALTVVADATDLVASPATACDALVVVEGSGREAVVEVAP